MFACDNQVSLRICSHHSLGGALGSSEILELLSEPPSEQALARGSELELRSNRLNRLMLSVKRNINNFITEAKLPCGSEVTLTASKEATPPKSLKYACTGEWVGFI